MPGNLSELVVAVVGPCTAGKTVVTEALRKRGYQARHIAQEHSYVRDMWQRIAKPDVLVYLDVSHEAACERRIVTWGPERMEKQAERLAHAREHCHLYVMTDGLTEDEVVGRVVVFLEEVAAAR